MNRVAVACEIARYAHRGQVDKAGKPYFEHPKAVVAQLCYEDEQIVGWLHDVLEDTDFSPDILREIFGDDIMDALDAITHRKDESWDDYISRVEKNPLAVRVKLADLTHNMDLTRLSKVTEEDLVRNVKYNRTYLRLMKSISDFVV